MYSCDHLTRFARRGGGGSVQPDEFVRYFPNFKTRLHHLLLYYETRGSGTNADTTIAHRKHGQHAIPELCVLISFFAIGIEESASIRQFQSVGFQISRPSNRTLLRCKPLVIILMYLFG